MVCVFHGVLRALRVVLGDCMWCRLFIVLVVLLRFRSSPDMERIWWVVRSAVSRAMAAARGRSPASDARWIRHIIAPA